MALSDKLLDSCSLWLLVQNVHNEAVAFILPHIKSIERISNKFATEDFVPNVEELI